MTPKFSNKGPSLTPKNSSLAETLRLLSRKWYVSFDLCTLLISLFCIFRGQPLKMPKDCLFSGDTMMDPALLKELKEKSKFALAVVAMREGRHEDALNSFEELYHPQAAYYTGLVSKK